ncbi:uracil-DNA glycosylase [Alcanivorax sp. JB21]|uniref:uracil-DNA glycosylase n=1 Tax=Alcanivorax limicola TaxID=2874102 RepID=UPI001CBE3B1F|nr:uracil-DNA glycosylase [Alcanivorax limicola]MBZ2189252.1 uracil-DNA glycosylase [Alcanivorax limicola]
MDRPKLLRDKTAREARLSQLDEAHVARLTDFVDDLRIRIGPEAAIPYFDPWDGGVGAEALFLLEAPGPKARNSGFMSMNNPDETAKNLFELIHEAEIDRRRIAIWNTVPWYIGSGAKIRPASSSDIASGIESLSNLFQLMPKLRLVVLVGAKAQKAHKHIQNVAPHLGLLSSPHPSPMFVNRRPGNREAILNSLRTVSMSLVRKKG